MTMNVHAQMIEGEGGITDPVVQLIITPYDNEIFEKVGLVDAHLTANVARHLGYTLLGLSCEADSQSAYILALRAMKENDEEIMEMVVEANKLITARRGGPA